MTHSRSYHVGHAPRVMAMIEQRRSASVEEVVNTLEGITAKQASSSLTNLWQAGKLHKARTGYHDTRYFFSESERDAYVERVGKWTPPAQRRSMPLTSRAVLDRNAPVIVPANVKVTIGPSYTHDPRVQFAPDVTRLPEGMKGAGFVADWNKKRRSRVTARSTT